MKIRIDDEMKLEEVIKEVEHGCRSRLLNVKDIQHAVNSAIIKLEQLRIPKKAWKGCIIEMLPEKVANKYQGVPYGTFAKVERYATGWFVTRIFRGRTGSQAYGDDRREFLNLSELAKSNIPNSFEI